MVTVVEVDAIHTQLRHGLFGLQEILEPALHDADILDSDEISSIIGETNAIGWSVDEFWIEYASFEKRNEIRVKFGWSASGEQLDDRMLLGTKVEGSLVAVVHDTGVLQIRDLCGRLPEYDDAEDERFEEAERRAFEEDDAWRAAEDAAERQVIDAAEEAYRIGQLRWTDPERPGESYKARYKRYLRSDVWKEKTAAVHERAEGICEVCGVRDSKAVHHLTYERIFEEPLGDLQAICHGCHMDGHDIVPDDKRLTIDELQKGHIESTATIWESKQKMADWLNTVNWERAERQLRQLDAVKNVLDALKTTPDLQLWSPASIVDVRPLRADSLGGSGRMAVRFRWEIRNMRHVTLAGGEATVVVWDNKAVNVTRAFGCLVKPDKPHRVTLAEQLQSSRE
jgi:hypothetical protein